jgi:hypothetical protein
MALVQRLITTSFSMANGSFGSGGNNATLTGLRTIVKGKAPGGSGMVNMDVAIYGMPLDMMNQLSTVGTQTNLISQNTLTVQVGDGDGLGNPVGPMTTIFIGTITSAWVDAQAMPQVCFRVTAISGGYHAVVSAPPTSYAGGVGAATIMGALAGQMGLSFENNGVTAQLHNPYFPGSPRMQALACAQAAGCEHIIEKGVLAIWNPGSARPGGMSQIIMPPPGPMVGYPAFNSANIIVRVLFDPSVSYGTQITVQSDLTPACGSWVIINIDYDLESLVPKGHWFAIITASPAAQGAVPS